MYNANVRWLRRVLITNRFLVRLLLSHLVLGLLLLSFSSAIVVSSISRFAVEEVLEVAESSAYQIALTTDKLFQYVVNYCTMLFYKAPEIHRFLASPSGEWGALPDLQRVMQGPLLIFPIIHSVYAYNEDSGVIVSTRHPLMSVDEFPDQGVLDLIGSQERNVAIPYTPRALRMAGQARDTSVVTFLYTVAGADREPNKSALVVNIDSSAAHGVLMDGVPGYRGDMLILDHAGRVVLAPTAYTSSSDFARALDDLGSSAEEPSSSVERIGAADHIVVKTPIARLGWTVVSTIPLSDMRSNFAVLRNRVFQITYVAFLLTVICSLILTAYLYHPLRRVLHALTAGKRNRTGVPELKLIEGELNELYAEVEAYAELVPDRNEFVLAAFLKHGRRPGTSKEAPADEVAAIVPPFPLQVVVVRITPSANPADVRLTPHRIDEVVRDALRSVDVAKPVSVDEDGVRVILVHASDRTQPPLGALATLMRTRLDGPTAVASSDPAHSVDDLHEAYARALVALDYATLLGREVRYADIESRHGTSGEYPKEEESAVLTAVRSADSEAARSAISAFSDRIRDYSSHDIRMFITQLALSCAKQVEASLKTMDSLVSIRGFVDVAGERRSLAQMTEGLSHAVSTTVESVRRDITNRDHQLRAAMESFVLQNLGRPELCVDLVADAVGLSTNHARYVFEKVNAKSLSRHIHDLRLEKACELLRATDLSGKQIAARLGFANVSYFYTAFRKHTGLSTREYKSLAR